MTGPRWWWTCGLLLISCSWATSAEWRVGVARQDITPVGPIWMAGYASRNHPSEIAYGLDARQSEIIAEYGRHLEDRLVAVIEEACRAMQPATLADVPSERVLKEGGYEAGDAMVYFGFHGPFQPGLEDRIVGQVKQLSVAMSVCAGVTADAQPPMPAVSLTVIPPSPVTDQIVLDVRGAVRNLTSDRAAYDVTVYLDREEPAAMLHHQRLEVAPGEAAGMQVRWPTQGQAGKHRIVLVAHSGGQTLRTERPLEILTTGQRSTRRLGGAWVDIYHHDEHEGEPFNTELGRMTDDQWRELVRAMHEVDQDVLVITMMFQNFTHRGRHNIETEGYPGKAYYPSQLFPGRMPIASTDPLEAILSEADRLGMYVMPGVGCYAFFDFTPGSLRWCEQVADELWQRYGHHPSFYGWYLSHEKDGGLGDAAEREEIVEFFRAFTPYVRRLAPDKPVMLAPNCYHLRGAEVTYRKLLPHLDIVCPFGYHRMPADDLRGEEAATLMQALCDEAGCHLWMDVESFVFPDGRLVPRPIDGLINDFTRFPNFEKILHYQFPGLMSGPGMSRQPGGPASVKLYEDYREYVVRLYRQTGLQSESPSRFP